MANVAGAFFSEASDYMILPVFLASMNECDSRRHDYLPLSLHQTAYIKSIKEHL